MESMNQMREDYFGGFVMQSDISICFVTAPNTPCLTSSSPNYIQESTRRDLER